MNQLASKNLIDAAMRREWRAAISCLEDGADPNYKDPNGSTAIHWAIQEKSIRLVRRLIEAGADLNSQDKFGVTPLFKAVGENRADIVELLLDSGVSPDDTTEFISGGSALHLACSWYYFKIVRILVEKGHANINKRNNEERTPLDIAIESKAFRIVRYLKPCSTICR